jgi:hypothetical protein
MIRINVYDPASAGTALPELPPLPIGVLMVGAAELLQRAADLPQPVHVTVHDSTQRIGVQFAQNKASIRAIVLWARRFGGVLTSRPDHEYGGQATWYRATFDYYGIAVDAFAYIPDEPGTT